MKAKDFLKKALSKTGNRESRPNATINQGIEKQVIEIRPIKQLLNQEENLDQENENNEENDKEKFRSILLAKPSSSQGFQVKNYQNVNDSTDPKSHLPYR